MAADLRANRPPSANVILYGPRGNGKTVLLNVIGDRLQRAGASVVQTTAHGGAASTEALEQTLAPTGGWRGWRMRWLRTGYRTKAHGTPRGRAANWSPAAWCGRRTAVTSRVFRPCWRI